MIKKTLISSDRMPHNLLSDLESREIALWVRGMPKDSSDRHALTTFVGLPWRLVLMESYDHELVTALEAAASFSDPLTRKRGFVQVIDSDPSRIELPQRCLPVYLLNGRNIEATGADFSSKLRRMNMLEELRRSGVREILVLCGNELQPVPSDLTDLWNGGFRSYLTFVSDAASAANSLEQWVQAAEGVGAINLVRLPLGHAVSDIVARYSATYPENRRIARMRDASGRSQAIDVTEADEPERPIFEHYSIIEERDVAPLLPDELAEEDFVGFFRNPEGAWRPYAAGLPWIRDARYRTALKTCLQRLDTVGSEDNCIAYISSESGAGGTTLARALAWECAREGYPVLVAKPISFLPEALPLVNFLNRASVLAEEELSRKQSLNEGMAQPSSESKADSTSRRYETPWVVVYDSLHWQGRDSELVRFRNELSKSGRPVCVLVVTGTILGLSFFNTSIFKRVAELNHALDQESARELGGHLNRFLRVYGKERQPWQWERFYQDHTVRYLEGTAAFWVTLSFWIQGQYDLSESIQQWIYRVFKEFADEPALQKAILEIAALSSERLPLPEALLPSEKGTWPVSLLLEDRRSSLAALGLLRVSTNGEKHWALVHDILGRFLINALFYDFQMRKDLGFADAKDAEHLRFLLLRQISQKPELGERSHRSIGEEFATSILKIDPDHGRGSFTSLWREVLDALNSMPRSLRDTSRVFRHHTAVSRRRIATLDESYYGVTIDDKVALLNEAIADINYALSFIEYVPGSEPNLNLFNSLANAYLDLAEIEAGRGASRERISELRSLANDATRKVYEESPTNSFVIETYVKNLLENAREHKEHAVSYCIESLGILFSALMTNEATYRKSQLGKLAEQALEALLSQTPTSVEDTEPVTAIDVLVKAWKVLASDGAYVSGVALSEVPEINRVKALDILAHPAGQGNMQVIRLSYDLLSITFPMAMAKQLELVEQLQATDYRITPQLRLEYAILLFENSRAVEGDKVFRSLRRLWRDSEHFVHVPERLRWLWTRDGGVVQTVQATASSDYGNRSMARVQEFNNVLVPFRPVEFGFQEARPGQRISGHVSFGHNGPLLRPVTAHPPKAS